MGIVGRRGVLSTFCQGKKIFIAAEKSGKKFDEEEEEKFIVETKGEEIEGGESRIAQMGSYIMKENEESIK